MAKTTAFEWGRFGPKALDFLANSTARINIAHGAVRSGKTITSIVRWIEYVATAPPGDLLLAGKTERTAYRNVIAPLQQILGASRCRYNRGTGELYMLGRRIFVVGANDERAEGKIRGLTLAGAYGDELTLWPESFFRMLMTRLSVEGAKFFGTTNPDSPFHYLKRDYLDRAGELDLRHWHFQLADNPNLSRSYIEALEREYTGLWRRRFILGEWVQAEGSVYDMFDESVHVVDDLPADPVHTWIVPIDYGTANPTAFLRLAVIRDRRERVDRVYVVDEYYYDSAAAGRQKTDAEYSADLRRFIAGIHPVIYLDPSAASLKAQLRRDGITNVRDADNDVLAGIRLVSSFLANKRLFFLRGKTPNLLREITSYVWDPAAQRRGEDRPLKQADHALDALRYGIYTHFKREAQARAPVPKHPAWA
ncbi:MAG: PBSX family phage terminase large subunit [Symbiobacteriaceae bacterium]